MRCSDVPDAGLILSQDYSVLCFTDEHWAYLVLAMISIGVYILGMPVMLYSYLWQNRKHLHDEESAKYSAFFLSFGGVYNQYEPDKWWFELVSLFTKMTLTGALGIFMPGSPVQLCMALIITIFYLLVVLKNAPYRDGSADLWKFLSTLTIMFTMLGGLILLMDEDGKSFSVGLIDALLMVLNLGLVIGHLVFIFFVKLRHGKKNKKTQKSAGPSGSGGGNKMAVEGSKVVPVINSRNMAIPANTDKNESENLRAWHS